MPKLYKILFLFFCFICVCLTAQQNQLQQFLIFDDAKNTSVNDITQDEIGYLWIATNKGVFQFDGVGFTQTNDSYANTIYKNHTTTYIAEQNGLRVINDNKTVFFDSKEVLKIVPLKDSIFLATAEGISVLKENYIQPLAIHTTIDFSVIYDIKFHNDRVFIASNKGLWVVNKLRNPKRVQKLSELNFHKLLIHKTDILGASKDEGLYRIDQNMNIDMVYELNGLQSVILYNDEIWLSKFNDGIEIVNATTFRFIRKINKYNSRITNQLTSFFVDKQNLLWIGSKNKGMYKYYNSPTNISKPSIKIEDVLVNYKSVNTNNFNKQKLPSSENTISFRFKTIDFINPKHIKYQYQLNDKLSPWSSLNKVDFVNLRPGNYTFSVQSKNGKVTGNKMSYQFTIDSPIYQKTWFYILVFSVLCLFIAIGVELRIRRVKKKNQEKLDALTLENHLMSLEQKALQLQMNPHFIFNVLNGIKALGNSGKSEELNKTISQFSVLLRSVLNNSRMEEISLSDEIDTLTNYLELEQKMSAVNFTFSIQEKLNDIDKEEILIPPMLLQPFVENCIKHAFTKNITKPNISIDFEIKHQFLHITIIDNGIGLVESRNKRKTTHESVALKVTRERIENLTPHHSYSISEIIENKQVKGTKVYFKLPLKTDF